MNTELTPAVPAVTIEPNDTADYADSQLSRVEVATLEWLQGFASAKTRNSYAADVGLRPELRRWEGAPKQPTLNALAWLPWCAANGLDPLTDVTRRHVHAWLHTLSSTGVADSTRRRRFIAVASWYAFLRGDGLTTINPGDMVNRKNMQLAGGSNPEDPTVPLTVAQIRALFVAARLDGTDHRERNIAIVAVLAATGCRVAELVGLDVEHYTRTSPAGPGRLRLHGKGNKWRTQRLPARDADLLDAYLQVRITPEGSAEIAHVGNVNAESRRHPLFTTSRGERMHTETIRPMLNRIAALPRFDHSSSIVRQANRELSPLRGAIHPHQFRHSYAVTAANHGKTPTQIRDDLGHASVATTQTYLAAASAQENSAAQVVSDIYHAGEDLALIDVEAPGCGARPTETEALSSGNQR